MLKILLIVFVLIGIVVGFVLLKPRPEVGQENYQPTSQNQQQDHSPGSKAPFYSKDGISMTHSWPGEENFSNEETEILIFNESDKSLEVKSFDLSYAVEGKGYQQKSGTWEKFPSRESWERQEYINISPNHYKGESLVLARGKKGKLHWHIQFGSTPLDGKQTVQLKLTLLKSNETIIVDEEFHRDSGQLFSKDEH